MATYTENYQLHQWVPEDNFLRTDFNQDFAKIDMALTGLKTLADGKASTTDLSAVETLANRKCELAVGSYEGDQAASRKISLPFAPTAVLVERRYGSRESSSKVYGGLSLAGRPASSGLGHAALELGADGFTVYQDGNQWVYLNDTGVTYYYMAFR